MPYTGSNHINPPKRRRTTIIIVIVAILAFLLLCCLVAVVCFSSLNLLNISDSTQQTQQRSDWGSGLILVYDLENNNGGLSAYILDLDKNELWLDAGRYYVELKTQNDTLLAYPSLVISDEVDGKGAAKIKQRTSVPLTTEVVGQQIETLVRFLVGVDNVRLTYFEIVSNGFQDPLFTNDTLLSWSDEEKLMDTFNPLGDSQTVVAAVQAFQSRADASKSYDQGQGILVAPQPGLIDSVLSFFGILDEENDRAQQEILAMYGAIKTPGEKEESFSALDASQLGGAANFDEFIEKVRNDEIQDLTSIRRDLMLFGPMEGIMQDLNPDSNRPGGEIIHRVGGEAVSRGAELNVEVIKSVLTASFPGIDQGFDYADKANEWAEYIHLIYTDPLQALGDTIKGQATDAIKNQVKSQFQSLFPDMDEADVDYFVDQIVEEVNETASTIMAVEEDYTQEATEETTAVVIDETAEETDTPQDPATETFEPTETNELDRETETPEPTATDEIADNGSGPPEPDQDIDLPEELAENEIDQNKDNNTDFVWDADGQCWNYIGPAYQNYAWNCASQCFNYKDAEWDWDCSTNCPIYIGPGSQEWVWNCQTSCWETLQPNYNYNCSTRCLEYIGPDTHLWYWDCGRNCLEYIGPAVSGYTWSCEWHRWVADE